jgi:hypothetical protein
MKALLYIPDISGFSNFVNETEITHGQEIITELMESIIDSNNLEMDIYELEGDAVVFYSFGKQASPFQLYSLSKEILRKFKERKEKMSSERLCECGACKSINNLTLKFIVHDDELSKIRIKNFTKLYGRGLIIAFLLLKNSIDGREYLLFTDEYLSGFSNENKIRLHPYTHNTKNFGDINTKYINLEND